MCLMVLFPHSLFISLNTQELWILTEENEYYRENSEIYWRKMDDITIYISISQLIILTNEELIVLSSQVSLTSIIIWVNHNFFYTFSDIRISYWWLNFESDINKLFLIINNIINLKWYLSFYIH